MVYQSEINFGRTRHNIEYDLRENLEIVLLKYLQPNIVTEISSTAEALYDFKETVKNCFSNKFVFIKIVPIDMLNEYDRHSIVDQKNIRAHRNLRKIILSVMVKKMTKSRELTQP